MIERIFLFYLFVCLFVCLLICLKSPNLILAHIYSCHTLLLIRTLSKHYNKHCVKIVQIRRFFWSVFSGKLPTNCLCVFDHFVKLALKGLKQSKIARPAKTSGLPKTHEDFHNLLPIRPIIDL